MLQKNIRQPEPTPSGLPRNIIRFAEARAQVWFKELSPQTMGDIGLALKEQLASTQSGPLVQNIHRINNELYIRRTIEASADGTAMLPYSKTCLPKVDVVKVFKALGLPEAYVDHLCEKPKLRSSDDYIKFKDVFVAPRGVYQRHIAQAILREMQQIRGANYPKEKTLAELRAILHVIDRYNDLEPRKSIRELQTKAKELTEALQVALTDDFVFSFKGMHSEKERIVMLDALIPVIARAAVHNPQGLKLDQTATGVALTLSRQTLFTSALTIETLVAQWPLFQQGNFRNNFFEEISPGVYLPRQKVPTTDFLEIPVGLRKEFREVFGVLQGKRLKDEAVLSNENRLQVAIAAEQLIVKVLKQNMLQSNSPGVGLVKDIMRGHEDIRLKKLLSQPLTAEVLASPLFVHDTQVLFLRYYALTDQRVIKEIFGSSSDLDGFTPPQGIASLPTSPLKEQLILLAFAAERSEQYKSYVYWKAYRYVQSNAQELQDPYINGLALYRVADKGQKQSA